MSDLYLAHHGIKRQKWGVRRYQNPDGSLTEEGRKHYGVGPARPTMGKYITGGAKVGATVGSGYGAVKGAILAPALIGAGIAPALAVTVGASYIASGALYGVVAGSVVGAMNGVEAKLGSKYLSDSNFDEVKLSDLDDKD